MSPSEKALVVEKFVDTLSSCLEGVSADDDALVVIIEDEKGEEHRLEISVSYLGPVNEDDDDEIEDDDEYD